MAFDFPPSPAVGDVANNYQWDGEKWKGGPLTPARTVTEQLFDMSGLTALDIPVPTWAKACTMDGWEFHTAGGAVMQISGDGTTFAAGASDYGYVGPMHMSGSGGFASLAVSSGSSILLTSLNTDAGMPTSFTVDLMLTRPSTSQRFMGKTYSKFYDVNAANQYRTMWLECHVSFTATTSLAIKALRILNASQAFGAGSFVRVKWLGEAPNDVVLPIVRQDMWNGSTVYTPGTTVVTPDDANKLFTMALGAGSVFTLPNIAGLPDGWSVLLRATGAASGFLTNYVQADADLVYNGVVQVAASASRFVLIGGSETFRFTKSGTTWVIECIASPGTGFFNFTRNNSGAAATYSTSSVIAALPGATNTTGTNTAAAIASGLGMRAPCDGVYAVYGRMYFNPSGTTGGVAGNSYVQHGDNTTQDSMYSSRWHALSTADTNSFLRTVRLKQADYSQLWYSCGAAGVYHYPPNNLYIAELLHR